MAARFCAIRSELGIDEEWHKKTPFEHFLGVVKARSNDHRPYGGLDALARRQDGSAHTWSSNTGIDSECRWSSCSRYDEHHFFKGGAGLKAKAVGIRAVHTATASRFASGQCVSPRASSGMSRRSYARRRIRARRASPRSHIPTRRSTKISPVPQPHTGGK